MVRGRCPAARACAAAAAAAGLVTVAAAVLLLAGAGGVAGAAAEAGAAAGGAGEVDCEELGFSPGSLLCGSCDDLETFVAEVRRSDRGWAREGNPCTRARAYTHVCVGCTVHRMAP